MKKTVKTAAKEWKQSRPVKLKFTYKEEREYETIDEDIMRALEKKDVSQSALVEAVRARIGG